MLRGEGFDVLVSISWGGGDGGMGCHVCHDNYVLIT